MSKTKSHVRQVLLKIDARRLCENNQQKCIDCLKLRSKKKKKKKVSLSVRSVVVIAFMHPKLLKNFIRNFIVHLVMYKMAVFPKIKSNSDAVGYFKELPFYNKPIKEPKVKRLKNIYQLAELPFYELLSVIKTNQTFRGYAM